MRYCFLRCFLDDWCLGCATTDDKRYIIIHRRGTEQEKQTLVSHAGGAIFTGEILLSRLDKYYQSDILLASIHQIKTWTERNPDCFPHKT